MRIHALLPLSLIALASALLAGFLTTVRAADKSPPAAAPADPFLGEYVGTFHPLGKYDGDSKPEAGKDFQPQKCGNCHTEAKIESTKDGYSLRVAVDHGKDKEGKPQKLELTLQGKRDGDKLAFRNEKYSFTASAGQVSGDRTGKMVAKIELKRKGTETKEQTPAPPAEK